MENKLDSKKNGVSVNLGSSSMRKLGCESGSLGQFHAPRDQHTLSWRGWRSIAWFYHDDFDDAGSWQLFKTTVTMEPWIGSAAGGLKGRGRASFSEFMFLVVSGRYSAVPPTYFYALTNQILELPLRL